MLNFLFETNPLSNITSIVNIINKNIEDLRAYFLRCIIQHQFLSRAHFPLNQVHNNILSGERFTTESFIVFSCKN